MDDATLGVLVFSGGAVLFLLGLFGIPRVVAWWLGRLAGTIDDVRRAGPQPAPRPDAEDDGAYPTSDDAVRRLMYARRAIHPLLDGEDRQKVDAQFLKLHDARAEAQAEVQRLFDMGMTMEKLRTMPNMSSEQLATIEEWVTAGDVVPPRG